MVIRQLDEWVEYFKCVKFNSIYIEISHFNFHNTLNDSDIIHDHANKQNLLQIQLQEINFIDLCVFLLTDT